MRRFFPLCILLVFTACDKAVQPAEGDGTWDIAWVNPIDSVRAGTPISLKFTGIRSDTATSIYISNAFGTTVLPLKKEENTWVCAIPKHFVRKAGPLYWKVLYDEKVKLANRIAVVPDAGSIPHVETYFGPRSITVGARDYSMLVTIPTDPFDNTLLAGTPVTIKSEFQNTVELTQERTADFIAWKNIVSKKTAGRMLVSASCLETDTKELTTILFPANAEAFEIAYSRNHRYADGNQIITFQTNLLKDAYGNLVGDGTLVTFFIKDAQGGYLKTTGMTIDGVAKASLLHPAEAAQWQVTAYVTGAAKSNTISVVFEQAISDFEVSFSEDQRSVTIGPLKSFMDQIVPDGIDVVLRVYDIEGKPLSTKKETTKKGRCLFKLPREYFENGTYQLEIAAAGMLKKYKTELR